LSGRRGGRPRKNKAKTKTQYLSEGYQVLMRPLIAWLRTNV
jgi:hypothetical protein